MMRTACLSAAVCAVLLAGCRESDAPQPDATSSSPALPTSPVAEAPLDREQVLLAVIRAGSNAAAGISDGEEQRRLGGKPFQVRIRVGCPDTRAPEDATRRLDFDEAQSVVRIELRPEIDGGTPLVHELTGDAFEAAEGFWIRRPWLLQPACPVPDADATATAGEPLATPAPRPSAAATSAPEPPPRIALAQLFTSSDARTHRRGNRAYQATEKLAEGERPGESGYDLVIEGRLQALPGGNVILCRGTAAGPPSCIVSARFDKVSLERADTGKLIAEWPGG